MSQNARWQGAWEVPWGVQLNINYLTIQDQIQIIAPYLSPLRVYILRINVNKKQRTDVKEKMDFQKVFFTDFNRSGRIGRCAKEDLNESGGDSGFFELEQGRFDQVDFDARAQLARP